MVRRLLVSALLCCLPPNAIAQDAIELQITVIKGNRELPKILYVVPWKDLKPVARRRQELELHSLEDDLFEPVLP